MSAIVEFLYPKPAKRTVGGIVKWWEQRRFAYNVVVGAAGMVTLGIATTIQWFLDGTFEPGMFIAAGFVGVGANLFYFLGPIVETVLQKVFGDEVLPTGPALYRMGLTFSVGLMLFPGMILSIIAVIRVLLGLFGAG